MPSVNRVILIGHLGADPETRYMPSGEAVTNFRVATTEKWKDKSSGEGRELTEWWRISVFGRMAEVAGEYLTKGAPVYIEGRGRTRKWEDKDGNERYTFEVLCDRFQMLGRRGDEGGGSPPPSSDRRQGAAPARAPAGEKKPAGKFDDMEDDIPF